MLQVEELEQRCLMTAFSLTTNATTLLPGQGFIVSVQVDRLYDPWTLKPFHLAPQAGMVYANVGIGHNPNETELVSTSLGHMGIWWNEPGHPHLATDGYSPQNPNGWEIQHTQAFAFGTEIFEVTPTTNLLNTAMGGQLIDMIFVIPREAAPGPATIHFTFANCKDYYDKIWQNLAYTMTEPLNDVTVTIVEPTPAQRDSQTPLVFPVIPTPIPISPQRGWLAFGWGKKNPI